MIKTELALWIQIKHQAIKTYDLTQLPLSQYINLKEL